MTAQKAEATDENTVTVTFKSAKYEVKRAIDIELLELMQEGKHVLVLRQMLGDAQWNSFKAKHKSLEELAEFTAALNKAAGDLGK